MSSKGDWTDAIITTLKLLWAEGHSTAEIGRQIGVSKNAVIGKVHRLNLPARPSPIRPAESGTPRATRRPRAPKLAEIMQLPSSNAGAPELNSSGLVPASPGPAAPPVRRLGATACCWPLGEPGTPEFRFCTALAIAGGPYCETHYGRAYRRRRRIHELRDAAAAW